MMLLKNKLYTGLSRLFMDPDRLQTKIESYDDLPADLASWLGKLSLLYGVPLNYLVPDEQMLPAESIRFFYVDNHWIEALQDGAYSIGRIFETEQSTHNFRMEVSAAPLVGRDLKRKASLIRTNYLGLTSVPREVKNISGFLLRSSVVEDYPGLGVDAYPKGGEPSTTDPGNPLSILRMEKLTSTSDTLLCLVEGEAYRIDIHEAPEALHYGIDSYVNQNGMPSGKKTVYPFEKKDQEITMHMENPLSIELACDTIFRKEEGGRCIHMSRLAQLIAFKTASGPTLDAAEMGFEMIEGVGMVSFYNQTGKK